MSIVTSLRIVAVFVGLTCSLLLCERPVHAAGGISIAPAIITLSVPAERSSAATTITIRNTYTSSVALEVSVRSVDEGNGVLVPRADATNDSTRQAIDVVPRTLSIDPGATATVSVIVTDVNKLRPGGSYAAVVFSEVSSSGRNVGLQAALSASLFVIRESGAVRSLNVKDGLPARLTFRLPSTNVVELRNTGNVRLVPRGSSTITQGGSSIGRSVLNQSSATLSPGTVSRLQSGYVYEQKPHFPALLQVEQRTRFDGTENEQVRTRRVLYVPPLFAIGCLVVIACVSYLVWRLRVHIPRSRAVVATLRKTRKISKT